MLEISLYTESRKSSYNLSHGSIGNKFMENKKKIIRNIAICMLLLIVASLYIAIKKNKDAEWFDEKELYSFSKETSCEELECKGYLCISDVFNEIPYKVKFFMESIEQGKDCYIKVYNQNEYDLIVHIFYYKRESDCIKEISYNTSEEGATILEYSDQIENKRSLDINYIILTPLKNDFTESEFLLCQYKKDSI